MPAADAAPAPGSGDERMPQPGVDVPDRRGRTGLDRVGRDLDRNPRAVGRAYRRLVRDWADVLPAQSVCLNVPVVLPSETDEPFARRRREWLRLYHARRRRRAPEPAVGDAEA